MTKDIVQFDDKWGEFLQKLHVMPINCSYEEACIATEIMNYGYFKRVVEFALAKWRDSTTTSILNGIANININTIPQGNMFSDITWQTRFLLMARSAKLLSPLDIEFVIVKDKPLIIKNEGALKVEGHGQFVVNKIVRALFLYWFINSKKQVKLPKMIYRGIRAHDLMNHDNFKAAVDSIWTADHSRVMKRKLAIDVLIKWICDKKLHEITDAKLLSFTANINVAKYFSNGNGLCLCVDPRTVEVITSEIHDSDNIGGVDLMSGKNEREYIVRIPDNYQFKPQDIIINDLDYFIAEENPLCVALFDHDDKQANYTMKGKEINVYFSWRNNNSGQLLFKVKGDYSMGRGEFRKNFGFDPLPTPANLSEITDFRVSPRKQW